MTTLRHLIWMLTAALGLILVASPSFAQAQYQDPGDQPGLIADECNL